MSIGLHVPPKSRPLTSDAAEARPETVRPATAHDRTWLIPGSLSLREVRRRFWHMAPGALAFTLHFVPHRDPISPTLRAIIAGCCLLIGLQILRGFGRIQRRHESGGTAAVAGYSLSVLLTVLLFPRHLELGLSVLTILAFGDGSATLFGLMIRGPRLPWNQGKSWSGLCAFATVGILTTAWMYHGETLNPEGVDGAISFSRALLIVSPAVIAAALSESVVSRLNDNIRVGAVAAVTLVATHLLLVW